MRKTTDPNSPQKVIWVAGIAFDWDFKKVVLIQRTKPFYIRGLLGFVGGHLEEGAAMPTGVAREFREETGVEVNDWTYRGVLNLERRGGVIGSLHLHTTRLSNDQLATVRTNEDKGETVTIVDLSGSRTISPPAIPMVNLLLPLLSSSVCSNMLVGYDVDCEFRQITHQRHNIILNGEYMPYEVDFRYRDGDGGHDSVWATSRAAANNLVSCRLMPDIIDIVDVLEDP